MKTTKLFFMAALALTFAACSNDDNDIQNPAQPAKAEGIPFTATISIGQSASTRALTENGTTIEAAWAENDEVALIHNDVIDKVTVASVTGGVATITGSITGSPTDGDAVTVVYPYSAVDATTKDVKADVLAAQDGTLTGTGGTSIAENYDVRKGTGTLKVDGTATLNGNVSLTNQVAIFKFTVQDLSAAAKAVSQFTVSDGSGNVITTVTPTTDASELYVALPALATGTYWFNATVDSKPYIAKATVSTATSAGTYYQSTVKMATLGDLMGADGKFYANAAAISTASTTAIGVIAYLGTDNFTENGTNVGGSTFVGHGLVLCLKNAAIGSAAQWSTEKSTAEFVEDAKVASLDALKRATNVSGYTNTKTLAGKTDAATKYKAAYAAKNYTGLTAPAGTTGWFLPSAQQWVKMQTGLGALAESSITWGSWFDTSHTAADKWENALSKAGNGNYDSMTSTYLYYWSSSEYSADYAVLLRVDATGTGADYGFDWDYYYKGGTGGNYRVRPVLAF